MSGNREKPKKVKKISMPVVPEERFEPAIMPEFRPRNVEELEWRPRRCPICRGFAMNRVYWREDHNVCILCYEGLSRTVPVVEEEEYHEDEEEWDDDEW